MSPEAIEAIEKLGGEVEITVKKGEVSTSVTLSSYFPGLGSKSWTGSDDDLKRVSKLPKVERLWLSSEKNTDAGLARI